MKSTHIGLFGVALAATLLSWSASAATIGYWRFENSLNLGADSSGAGRDLSVNGTPVAESLPPAFPTQIPRTQTANASCLRLDGASFLYRADEPAFGVTAQMTIEAFFSISSVTVNTSHPIASQYSDAGNQKGWVLAVRQDSGQPIRLRFVVAQTGSGSPQAFFNVPDWELQLNRSYYAAVVFSGGTARCYLADLAAGTPTFQVYVASNLVASRVFDSTGDFRIGAIQSGVGTPSNYVRFNGLIDEVRWSAAALPASDLLFSSGPWTPPQIDSAPQASSVGLGDDAVLTVLASGSVPLGYQWHLGDTPVLGATNMTLLLTNATPVQAGFYFVVVSNVAGSVTSAPVSLTIVDTSNPTVGYWRFENESALGVDSSGGGRDLSLEGAVSSDLVPLGFPEIVPQTGQPNLRAVSLDGSRHLYRADEVYFDSTRQRFTIEAFFTMDGYADDVTLPIASQWSDANSQKGWVFAVREDLAGFGLGTPRLRMTLDRTGNGSSFSTANATKWALEAGRPYYAAAVYDAGTLTLYLADLSVGNPVLESEVFTSLITNVFNTSADFRIGAFQLSTSTNFNHFFGKIDEVRLSNRALALSELLFSSGAQAAPQIQQAPRDFAALENGAARLHVVGSGTPPPQYQWYAGGIPVTGATSTVLAWTNVTPDQAGLYAVVLSNSVGSVTSAPVRLIVVDGSRPTLGYWRFESAAQLGQDSGGNGFDLSGGGTSELLGSGSPGEGFLDPIPLTGQANSRGLRLSETNLSSVAWPWVPLQLTAESFFNLDTFGDTRPYSIVCQWDDMVANSQGWLFGVALSSGATRLQFRTSAGTATATKWELSPGIDYYGAAVFDQGAVTFYFADLNSPEWLNDRLLDTQTVTGLGTVLTDVPSRNLRIGGYQQAGFPYNGALFHFNGLVDEVRVSQGALGPSALLVGRNAGTFTRVAFDSATHAVLLTAQGNPGQTYALLRSADLGDPQGWVVIALSLVADANGIIQYTDAAPPAAGAFYRLRLP